MYRASYRRAIAKAHEVLEMYGITQVPLALHALLEQLTNEIRAVPYSHVMERRNLTLKELCELLDTEFGACHYRRERAQYVIYYNDFMPEATWRFTIAHELGHIFLEHHEFAATDVLNRTGIPQELYDELEKEANAFARNLLSPAPTAYRITRANPCRETEALAEAFFLSEPAAETRFGLLKTDLRYITKEMRPLYENIRPVPLAFVCINCGNLFPLEDRFCAFCGGDTKRREYAYIPLPEEREAPKRCLSCGAERLAEDSLYCHICGSPLENECPEGHRNPRYARFCTQCAGPVWYTEAGEPAAPKDYGSEVPYDKESLTALVCPGCGTERQVSYAEYCTLCGTPLVNYCDCDRSHENPPHALYCHRCGRSTVYSLLGIAGKRQIHPLAEWLNRVDVRKDGFCPACDTPVGRRSKRCGRCGCPLENRCTKCGMPARANARYCAVCGKPTEFSAWYLFEEATQRKLDETLTAQEGSPREDEFAFYDLWGNKNTGG